jgi:hypothetical protein
MQVITQVVYESGFARTHFATESYDAEMFGGVPENPDCLIDIL